MFSAAALPLPLPLLRVQLASDVTTPGPLPARPTVDRKLVKQTVMTSVYGVTFVGARAQVGGRGGERLLVLTPFPNLRLRRPSCCPPGNPQP
mgnify:CR=1 FL=1